MKLKKKKHIDILCLQILFPTWLFWVSEFLVCLSLSAFLLVRLFPYFGGSRIGTEETKGTVVLQF